MRKFRGYNDVWMSVSIRIRNGYVFSGGDFGTGRESRQYPPVWVVSAPGYSHKPDKTSVVDYIGFVHRNDVLKSVPIKIAHVQTITTGEIRFTTNLWVIDYVFSPGYVLAIRSLRSGQRVCYEP